MQSRIGTRRLATIAIFAAIYAVLSLIPVSRLVGNLSFLTMAEVFSPLAGMVLGPFEGGLAVLVGTFAGIALGHPVAFDGLDFIPGVIAAVTAGYAMKGRVKVTLGLTLLMYLVYMVDPLLQPSSTWAASRCPTSGCTCSRWQRSCPSHTCRGWE